MKIAVFSTAYYPFVGGAEVAIKEIVARSPKDEWHIITALRDKKLPRTESLFGATVHRVGVGASSLDKFLLPFFGTAKALSLHRGRPFDRIWSMMASQASVAAAFFKILSRVPLVLTLQEGDEEEYLKRYVGGSDFLYKILVRPWYRLVFKKADEVTVISRYLGSRARAVDVWAPITVIPNGVDLTFFTPASRKKKRDEIILFTTSRLVEKNGNEHVIRALPLLPGNVIFWLVGHGPLESELKELARSLGVEKRVIFFGHPGHEAIRDKMHEADIFVRPSLSEGLGISFLEAMAAKVPLVATMVGGIPDFLTPDVTGVACLPKDPVSVAAAIQKLIDNPELAHRVAENAYLLAHDRYDWNKIAPKMHDILMRGGTKSKVLIAAGIYPPQGGGPALHAYNYYNRLGEEGVGTKLVAFSSYLPYPKGIRHVLYLWKLLRSSRGATTLFAQDISSVGYPSLLVARLLGKPLVVRIGGDIAWESEASAGRTSLSMREWYTEGRHARSRLYPFGKKILQYASRVIVPTQMLAEIYAEYYGVESSKVAVMPNPIPFTISEQTPARSRTIVFASRLVAYKNLTFVLESLARVSSRVEPFTFIICGDGPERASLEALSQSLGLGSLVQFRGNIREEEVRGLTRDCMITLAPALTEFNPNFVLRGMAYGKPFLMSRENGFPFTVPESFLFDSRNSEEFEQKLEQMLSPTGYREALQKLAKVDMPENWDHFLSRIASLLKTV